MEPPRRRGRSLAPRGQGSDVDPFEAALAELTAPQARAVASDARAFCVVAGAGSGKTRVLTLRMARRIRDGSAAADHTVVCTFTRKAARELQERLRAYGVAVSSPAVNGCDRARRPRRHDPPARAQPAAAPRPRRGSPVAHDRRRPGREAPSHRRRPRGRGRGGRRDRLGEGQLPLARALRRRGLDGRGELRSSRSIGWSRCSAPIRRASSERDRVDLDDILVRATELLVEDAGLRRRAPTGVTAISSSTSSRTSTRPSTPSSTRLGGDEKDLCVVGDPNQAIYGWNGADPTLLDRLPRARAGARDRRARREPPLDAAGGGGRRRGAR